MQTPKEEDGSITTSRERCEDYQKLYKDTGQNIAKLKTEEVPSTLNSEVKIALIQLKNSKAPEKDQIVVEMIRVGREISLKKILELRQNKCLRNGTNVIITLILQKGEKNNLANYWPISLLSFIYKLFVKALKNRSNSSVD